MATPLLQHYRYLLDTGGSTPDKCVVIPILDRNSRLMRWNRSAQALTGHSEKEIVGRPFGEALLFEEDVEAVTHQFNRIMSGWRPGSFEYRWKLRDGSARWMDCSNFEQCTSPGGKECLVFKASDITRARLTLDWRTSLFEEFIRARDFERHQIARFIHDTVAQSLVSLMFSLERGRRDPKFIDAVEALDLVERCCREVRLLGYMIGPQSLTEGDLVETIAWHAAALRESGALDIDVLTDPRVKSLSPRIGAVLFLAVHEFTAKAIVNRASKKLTIVLRSDGVSVVLEMKGAFGSNGAGDRDHPSIREQIRAIGGSFAVTPFSVRIALPTAFAQDTLYEYDPDSDCGRS